MFKNGALRALMTAAVAGFALAAIPPEASAEGFFDLFWGGDERSGGERHMVSFPKNYDAGQLIVSFGDRRLYHVVKAGQAMSYPIAVPREQSRWSGVTSVSMKRENPDWTPTAEMRAENPRLPPYVPGGHPQNPLGNRAMYLGSSTYRIHGTDAPWTIGQPVSKGCIRMFNQDVAELYARVPVGTKVTVTWERFNNDTFAWVKPVAPQPRMRPPYGAQQSGYYQPRTVIVPPRRAMLVRPQRNAWLD
jgi:lipoprotein-anchoring transpeptidase ErfK/SrfK